MLEKFLSLFSKKEANVVPAQKQKLPTVHTRTLNALKNEVAQMQSHSTRLNDELAKIKEHVASMPDHLSAIDSFHKKHESHERKLEAHAEKFNQIEGKLNDHRIDVIELKSRLNELNHSLMRFETLFGKVAELEKRTGDAEVVKSERVATKIARASAPAGSLIEQYHILAPSTKKILSLLLNMHLDNKGKWVPLSDLRSLVYPGEASNSTLAAMAKAIRPLYENGFVEKKRDKSFVYVAATKKGRDAAKEAGLNQQAEKFDAVFAKLDDSR